MFNRLGMAVLLVSGSVAAYPISPRTLVTQIQESELVIVTRHARAPPLRAWKSRFPPGSSARRRRAIRQARRF
jgi:hypothetical protein